jgi:hypothetical protein
MIFFGRLNNYIFNVHFSIEFSKLQEICDLAQKMVETKKSCDISFSLFIGDFGINLTSCDCHSRKSIFSYEDCGKSTV